MKQPKIRSYAVIKDIQKGSQYRCQLEDNETHVVIAYPSGRIQAKRIALCVADEVTVELSPYDLTHGRIVWRH